MKTPTPPVQVIETIFKTDKGQFGLYHLIDDVMLRRVLSTLNIKQIAGRATVTDTKRAFMNAINTKAGSRIVFISKEALLSDMDKRLHKRLQSLPMSDRILNKK